ncbi:MAG TPA: hypothetical protein VFI25_12355 [Planctomycetota bacterium]|nr:hypothetical protein [Planctomycetota bacterium]
MAYPSPLPSGPLALADALLAEAERNPDPAPLIAAARALLASAGRTSERQGRA